MADFSHVAAAIERAMGWQLGAFAHASAHAEEEARSVALEGSSITTILVSFVNLRRGQEFTDPYAFDLSTASWTDQPGHVLWRGSMTELLKELKKVGGELHRTETDWQRKIPD